MIGSRCARVDEHLCLSPCKRGEADVRRKHGQREVEVRAVSGNALVGAGVQGKDANEAGAVREHRERDLEAHVRNARTRGVGDVKATPSRGVDLIALRTL